MAECTISVDVGTGSTRSAAIDRDGRVLCIEGQEYDQIVPRHGWSEQRPLGWWLATCHTLRKVTDWTTSNGYTIDALAACGQMHGTVLLDDDGQLARETAPLWNDKRTLDYVRDLEAGGEIDDWLRKTANPPTPAWPAFKLQWLRDNDPEAWKKTSSVLMPKDYINFRLTGERAMDWTEAACTFLMDPKTRNWSPEVVSRLGLDLGHLLPIGLPTQILGKVQANAAAETGLPSGTPVLLGGGDYPLSLLGSGVCRPGMASEVSGTSSILTLVTKDPVLDPEISNIGTPEGNWGGFILLEAGGGSARWARQTFHDKALSYKEVVDMAAGVDPGAGALFFLPYLVGERLGTHRNSRAQYFGLSAAHGIEHMHRAVFEGVGFAVNRHLEVMETATGAKADILIGSGGGAKTDLWVRIRAAIYDRPIYIPEEPESGLVGNAMLVGVATGRFSDPVAAAERMVRYEKRIDPDPAWSEHYARMQPLFDRLHETSQQFYDELDQL